MNTFRPSGDLAWVLGCSSPRAWRMFGCIGPESRSIEVLKTLKMMNVLGGHQMVCIRETESPYAKQAEELLLAHIKQANGYVGKLNLIERDLLTPASNFLDDPKNQTASVIFDVSCMPKRFFFCYLKHLLRDSAVENLILTYCSGEYSNAPLSGNPDDWDILPTFRPTDRTLEESARQRLVVNLGFMPDGLQAHLAEDDSEQEIHILLPFPARASLMRRVWRSAMHVHKDWNGGQTIHVHRVGAEDLSGAFDVIRHLAASKPVSLAPFGPKPISAAMCIYASLAHAPVYYAQPKWYSPQYTLGAQLDAEGNSKISAFWIKHNGVALYSL